MHFSVDKVKKNRKQLSTTSLRKQLLSRNLNKVLSCSHDFNHQVVQSHWHPLLHATHAAYSLHYPLRITPDAFWIMLSQGFALHIANNAELLRDFFVGHQDKETLKVGIHDALDATNWQNAVQDWCSQIEQHVGPETTGLFTCNFSTTTPITRTASQIVMMDGLREYFDYRAMFVCGIPAITLEGTVEDWENIRARVQQMAFYDLDWWTRHLLPICDELILTAMGEPSLAFWQDIYLPIEQYSGQEMTGWLKWCFPYLKDGKEVCTRKNHRMEGDFPGFHSGGSLPPAEVPDGLSRVDFKLQIAAETLPLQLVGGFLGMEQCPDECIMQPLVGWGVVQPDSVK
ncbi:hypothetical protein GCM10008938_41310 [Deinococcus roseus]|uniref:DUF4419 domain-containing protein n=1 Tax=Deinococcus roseus TaxID=392414 RepID=A0ABQ2DDU9_9DEIO|nr:hypothetical protein GCM10008938_41310 [Deinococcus roseus]